MGQIHGLSFEDLTRKGLLGILVLLVRVVFNRGERPHTHYEVLFSLVGNCALLAGGVAVLARAFGEHY